MGVATELLQQVASGTATGCIYALVALGFILIFKATEVVNFAQGDLMMIGAFLGLTFIDTMHMPYWLGALLAIVVMAGFGALLNLLLAASAGRAGHLRRDHGDARPVDPAAGRSERDLGA